MMKIVILLGTLLSSVSIDTAVVISIGQACNPAVALRALDLRKEAYPFDWTVSPFQSLYSAFQDDFHHYIEPDSLTLRKPDHYGVLNYYGIHLVHDFPAATPNDALAEAIGEGHITGGALRDNWRSFIPMVHEKYQRRIGRLRRLFLSGERIYLIRLGDMTKQQAVQLRDLLLSQYPASDFVIVVINQTAEMKHDWQLPRIINKYVDFQGADDNPVIWRVVYEELGLL